MHVLKLGQRLAVAPSRIGNPPFVPSENLSQQFAISCERLIFDSTAGDIFNEDLTEISAIY